MRKCLHTLAPSVINIETGQPTAYGLLGWNNAMWMLLDIGFGQILLHYRLFFLFAYPAQWMLKISAASWKSSPVAALSMKEMRMNPDDFLKSDLMYAVFCLL